MNKKLRRILEPGAGMFFVIFILFIAVTAFFSLRLALGEAVAVLIVFLVYRRNSMLRRREIVKYIENITGSVNLATRESGLNSPIPMVIMKPDGGEIIWSNDRFKDIFSEREHLFEAKIADIVPDFPLKWLFEGKDEAPSPIAVGDRNYKVYGTLLRGEHEGPSSFISTLYWIECTDHLKIQEEFNATRPIVALILMDNYDEIMKNESSQTPILAAVEAKVNEWADISNGLLRKYDRDKYLFIFEERHLQDYIDGKFALLESVREILSPQGIPATLSIGIGKDGEGYSGNFQQAALAIDMALSRGGDQAVIKNRFTFDFYGGRAKEPERRTKVKSRVMANALSELMKDASQVLVMGHKSPDLDCIGAGAGIACIARKLGKRMHFVTDLNYSVTLQAMAKLSAMPEYNDMFISEADAMLMADANTLMIVVDTSRPEQTESDNLLMACNRIAVIDHHRRAATYIENAALNFHEPYASSASELVTELLQHLVDHSDILRAEADMLMAGIVLDTKNFTMRTGVRTFEAAAFLQRAGADTTEVKKLFQSDFDRYIARFDIIRSAQMYRGSIAIAAVSLTSDRITAAQAADELLNVSGVQASFVLYPNKEAVIISARSMGQINVQVILEKLGGGGNMATAGAQIYGTDERAALEMLLKAIDEYFDED